MSRRTLLQLGGLGVASAFGACNSESAPAGDPLPLPIGDANADTDSFAPDCMERLRSRLSGNLVLPGDSRYDAARVAYNPFFDNQRPAAIAECVSPSDVQACIEAARCGNMAVAARSGGHSYGGYSTPDRGLVVDLAGMSSITVNSDGTAVIGAGARLIDVYAKLAEAGRSLPGGTCASVGIAGLTLGGGVSVFNRLQGLTCDSLLSAEVVLADGSRRIASAEREPDLYWALRGGGGGNFGIVTSFTFRTHPALAVTQFGVSFRAGTVAAVLGAWQEWIAAMPRELWANCVCNSGTPPGAFVGGVFAGTPSKLTPLIDDLVRRAGVTPTQRTATEMGYLEAMKYLAGCADRTVAQCHLRSEGGEGQLERDSIVASSRVIGAPLSDPSKVDAVLQGTSGIYLLIDPFGGAVADLGPADTAFVHRRAVANVQITTAANASNREERTQAVAQVQKALAGFAGTGSYINYIDPHMSDWATACYGANLPRLKQVARRYDPDGVFAFAQNVRNA